MKKVLVMLAVVASVLTAGVLSAHAANICCSVGAACCGQGAACCR